jgi:endonuclease VIII
LPEGDTIWRAAAALRRAIEGQLVRDARPSTIDRLKGRRVEAIETAGKHLTLRFDGRLALHSHMGMTGSWHLYSIGERWRQPSHRATVVLTFDRVVAVCFAAPVMELVADPLEKVAHLGPDVLVEPFDLDEVMRRARASGAGTVGELLLDQRVCAGIGNIYKSEALWAQRLDPWIRPSEVEESTLRRLYGTARELMRHNLSAPIGQRRHAVYGRARHSCLRCGSAIQVRAQGAQARPTYFCPRCQGVGKGMPSPDRTLSIQPARTGRKPEWPPR